MRLTMIRIAAAALAFSTLACVPSGVSVSIPSADEISTSVAATLESALPEVATVAAIEPTLESPAVPHATPPAPGSIVVYTDGGNVWLAAAGAAPRQLTSSGGAESVLISSDGMRVVFLRRESPDVGTEIRVVGADGSGETVLVTRAQIDGLYSLESFLFRDISNLAFIPGTHRLLLNTKAVAEGPGLLKYNDLLHLDADTGALTPMLAPEAGGDFGISPDGSKVAIVTPDSIGWMKTDGTSMHPAVITYAPVITYSEYQYYAHPVWNADASAFAVAIPSAEPLTPPVSGSVWSVSTDGGPAALQATISGEFFFSQFDAPAVAPDLMRLAFLRETTTPNVRELILANLDGSNETVVTTDQVTWKGWSPDGSRFLYAASEPTFLQMGVVGGASTAMPVGASPMWADASSYVYLAGSSGAWTLSRTDLAGTTTVIAHPAGDYVSFDVNH
jgi:Tol biopolymer transport system component